MKNRKSAKSKNFLTDFSSGEIHRKSIEKSWFKWFLVEASTGFFGLNKHETRVFKNRLGNRDFRSIVLIVVNDSFDRKKKTE